MTVDSRHLLLINAGEVDSFCLFGLAITWVDGFSYANPTQLVRWDFSMYLPIRSKTVWIAAS